MGYLTRSQLRDVLQAPLDFDTTRTYAAERERRAMDTPPAGRDWLPAT